MKRQEARAVILPRLRDYVESKTTKNTLNENVNAYYCPLCEKDQIEAKKRTGMQKANKTAGKFCLTGPTCSVWTCSRCFKSGDIFTLIKELDGLESEEDAEKAAFELYGLTVDPAEEESGPELEETPPAAQITGGPADPGAEQSAQDLPGRGVDRAEHAPFVSEAQAEREQGENSAEAAGIDAAQLTAAPRGDSYTTGAGHGPETPEKGGKLFNVKPKNTESMEDIVKNQKKAHHLSNCAAAHIQAFQDGITAQADTPAIQTGFPALDEALDGGLYEGLYIIGGVPSLGKTSLVLQISDQIAERGSDVLFFSLEMARTELMAKSISRLTLEDVARRKGPESEAKTERGITDGSRRAKYSKAERDTIERAIDAYKETAQRLYIFEGTGNIGAAQIRQSVEDHIAYTGRRPVVVVDYLQIMAPADVRASDKQNTDKAVVELKRIARDKKTPVIAVSSFNRGGYTTPVKMADYKETGGIEYGADCLMGLQFANVGESGFDVDAARLADPRRVQLVILKNRHGESGSKVNFEYRARFNSFIEPSPKNERKKRM